MIPYFAKQCPKCDFELEYNFEDEVLCPKCKTSFINDVEDIIDIDGDEITISYLNQKKEI